MKKISMMFLLISIFVLAGCGKTVTSDGMSIEKRDFGTITEAKPKDTGNETITCSAVQEDVNVTMYQDIKLNFKSNILSSASVVIDARLDSDYLDYIDSFVSNLKKQFVNFQYGKNVEVKKTSKGAKVTYSMDESNFQQQYGSVSSKNAIISALEQAGYDCD